MANTHHLPIFIFFLIIISNLQSSFSALIKQQPLILKYHNGELLRGPLTVNLIWYGKFSPSQRSIISDFIQSLNPISKPSPSPAAKLTPSVASWWRTTEKYHNGSSAVTLGKQIIDEKFSLGKNLKNYHLQHLAGKLPLRNSNSGAVTVVLTSKDVTVDGFCRSRCATHGSTKLKAAYLWVGNAETQCPGYCAWPFHQPVYGPQSPALVAPNGDVGVDGMVINLATVLAGAVTNPFKTGFFQGPVSAPLEAVSACTGIFGSGAYPGYAGEVLVDKVTGASFNAYGLNGRKYLVPAMWDPKSSVCFTLV